MPTDDIIDQVAEALAELVRKEVPQLLRSGKNWKLIFNGSAAGDVRTATELHCEVVRQFRTVSRETN